MHQHLSICEEIEQTVGGIYLLLANQSQENRELNTLLTEMAADEMEHARLLQFARRLDHKTFKGSTLDLDHLGQLLVQVREVEELVQLRVLNSKDAVGMMLNLEEKFMQVHARYALEFKESSMQDMFEKLGREDEHHVAKLRSYHQRCVS